jgi:excisionase family DNA binding protein
VKNGDWLSIKEVAAQLGCGVRTLYDWRQRHCGPPAKRFGRRIKYSQRSLDGWIRDSDA